MAWTLDLAVEHVRDLLQDTAVDDYRSPDTKIVRVIALALVEARKLRPDLFLPNIHAYVPVMYTTSDLGADPQTILPIDPMYFPAIVDYVVGYISLEDDEFAVGCRATALLNRFSQKLIGKGA